MENLRTSKIKKLLLFVLPIVFAILSFGAIYFITNSDPKQELTLNTQQSYNTSIQSLPEVHMIEPETRHYYNELQKKKLADGPNSSKELACKIYDNLVLNIENILSGTPFNVFSGISSSLISANYSSAGTEFQNAIDAFNVDYPVISNMFQWVVDSYDHTTFTVSTTLPANSSITSFNQLRNSINKMTDIANSFNFAPSTTDYEKVLVVHDFIINTTTYQTNSELNQTAYSALINGSTVCAGYAKSFKYIMDALDIECILLSGLGGEKANPESHMWNYVKLNSIWYCIDLTWDDSGNILNYNYFLINSNTFTDDGTNVHILKNNFQYNGGGLSEMTYTFPTPSSNDFNYPENPSSSETYSTHVNASIAEMTLGEDYNVQTIAPVKRGNYVLIVFTLLDKDAYYLETDGVVSNGSTPMLVSVSNQEEKTIWTYRVIITNVNCNITFNFDTYLHDITLLPIDASDGTATINKTEAEKDETITIEINLLDPTTRSIRAIVIKDEQNNTINCNTILKNQRYTFKMPSTDTTVQILIATIFSISQGEIENGSATLNFSKTTAMEGETITVEVVDITDGMRATALSSTTVSEFVSAGKKTNKFSFVMPSSNVVVNATLTPIPPTVETKNIKVKSSGGSANISYSVEALEVGEEVTITIKPDFGKRLKSIQCNGVSFKQVVPNESYSFVVPSADFELNLEFEDKFGFDAMLVVYGVCGVAGLVFIIFLFTAFPKKDKKDYQ